MTPPIRTVRLRFRLTILLALVSSGCGQPLTPALSHIVEIRSAFTLAPIAHAHLSALLDDRTSVPTGETDVAGRWAFSVQSDVGYTVFVEASGYTPKHATVEHAKDVPILIVVLSPLNEP